MHVFTLQVGYYQRRFSFFDAKLESKNNARDDFIVVCVIERERFNAGEKQRVHSVCALFVCFEST